MRHHADRRPAHPAHHLARGGSRRQPDPRHGHRPAADFAIFVTDDIDRRRRIEADAQAEMDQVRAERIGRLRRSWALPMADTEDFAPDSVASDVTDEEDRS